MQCLSIAVGMIEETYESYKSDWVSRSDLSEELNKFDIPVWNSMNDNTKCAAIEYVYKNRHTIELHSGCVEAWTQAAAYFMILNFVSMLCHNGTPDIEVFFDDLDFMMDEDTLNDEEVQQLMGIGESFTEKF
jgi:hypothetical protein